MQYVLPCLIHEAVQDKKPHTALYFPPYIFALENIVPEIELCIRYNKPVEVPLVLVHYGYLALFPGLHAQLLSLAVRKQGEGLDGFIT